MSKLFPKLSTSRVILGVTAIAVIYFLVASGLNAVRSHQLREEEGRLQAEIQQLQQRYQRLEVVREYLNSDEYLEAVAREQLGLAREGETTFVVTSTAPPPTAEPDQPQPQSELWWEALIR